jgi:hypothetical protein
MLVVLLLKSLMNVQPWHVARMPNAWLVHVLAPTDMP